MQCSITENTIYETALYRLDINGNNLYLFIVLYWAIANNLDKLWPK